MGQKLFADFSLLLVTLVWGATFVVVQNAVAVIEPFSFNAIRFLLATLFLLLWIFIFSRQLLKEINRKLLLAGFLMGSWLCVAFALQTFALMYTTSSKTGFLTGLNVVMVPIFAYFFLKQKLKPNALIGILLALGGLYFLTLGDTFSINIGDALAFLCAIAFAMHIIVTSKYTHLYSSLLLTTVQIGVVALWSVVGAVVFEPWQTMISREVLGTPAVIFALMITAVFATAVAFLVQTYAQKLTSPSHVALIITMEPVFAALTGFIWAGDRLTSKALLGCFLIFIGMILAELPDNIFSTIRGKRKTAVTK